MIGTRLDSVDCRQCRNADVYMDVKEEPAVYKIGAYCDQCDHDYGVLHRVPRSDIDHIDEVYELGERTVTDILNTQ